MRGTFMTTGACVAMTMIGCATMRPAVTSEAASAVWHNESLQASWRPDKPTIELTNRTTGASVLIPIRIAGVVVDSGRVEGFAPLPGGPRIHSTRNCTNWRFVLKEVAMPDGAGRLRCSVEFAFDNRASWIRKKAIVEVVGSPDARLLKEVILEAVEFAGQHPRQPFDGWQSYPVLCDSFFCGVEFPVAAASVQNESARLSYKPGVHLRPGNPHTTWSTVYGVTAEGKSREGFESYVASIRPKSGPIHIQYNSWWSAPAPFTEQHMLDLMEVFNTQLYKPYGRHLDTFCLDMGWSNLKSLWQIDTKNFPRGFSNLTSSLRKMDARLGLWVSPSSCYPGAQDNDWAEANGYETFVTASRREPYGCLAGAKYQSAFKKSLVSLTRRYGITHFKFDGYLPECPEKDHGHEPGPLSSEKVALGIIDIFKSIRAANPDVWMEATCFGFRPSPWWLAYVNAVIGTFGDDAPYGRVPCPVYRESYTTARDYYNLQGTKDVLIPISAQEVLGIIHQTTEPLQNDAVTTILRGHSFIPLYVNPKHMDARRWRFLAHLCDWARKNATLLTDTRPLYFGRWADPEMKLGQQAPHDPYGYAHCSRERGLLLVRNPWIKPVTIEITMNEAAGVPKLLQPVEAVCLYPEFGKQAEQHSYGDSLPIRLGPYETRLLAFGGYHGTPPLVEAKSDLSVRDVTKTISPETGKARVDFAASGTIGKKQLWVLAESEGEFTPPECHIEVNGAKVEPELIESQAGWKAAGGEPPERWAWFVADLPAGESHGSFHLEVFEKVRASAWLVSKEPVPDDPSETRPIPPPELKFNDATEILAPVDLEYGQGKSLTNYALASQGAVATASSVWSAEHEAKMVNDGDPATRWNSAGGNRDGAWVQIEFCSLRTIQGIRFVEAAGGRITRYRVQYWDGNGWQDGVQASKLPEKAVVRHRFEPFIASKVRLLAESATEVPSLFEFEAFGE